MKTRELTDAEVALLDEALHALLRDKKRALELSLSARLPFAEIDFGIPQINGLIALLGGAGVVSATVPGAHP